MKKTSLAILSTTLLLTLAACGGLQAPSTGGTTPGGNPGTTTVEATGISLNESQKSLEVGDGFQLVATVSPSDATDKTVTWSSSDSTNLSVSSTGYVTARGVTNEAVVTATTVNGLTAFCTFITYEEEHITPSDVDGIYEVISTTPTVGSYVLIANSDYRKAMSSEYTSTKNNRSGVDVTISSKKIEKNDSLAVFRVDEGSTSDTYAFYDLTNKGYLAASTSTRDNKLLLESTVSSLSSFTVSTGEEKTITASSGTRNVIRWNSTSKIFSCYASGQKAVSLYQKAADPVYPESISITGEDRVALNNSINLTVKYTPSTTNVKNVTWSSSNTSVATIDSNGKVTAKNVAGTTTITATAKAEGNTTVTATKVIEAYAVSVTGVSLDKSEARISTKGSLALTPTVTPSNASNKSVTWSSSNTGVATVSNGVVSPVSEGTTTIKVTTVDGGHTASCSLEVYTKTADDWTILIYMCGADLESGYANQTSIYYNGQYYSHDGIGMATADIMEILSVKGQPEDVNIVIETGGCKEWTTTSYANYGNYNISNEKIQRHHVENNKIVLDEELTTYSSMGLTSTFQSFLEYGLNNYPAEKTGVILWNHGGGMRGVCYDEKKSDDSLLTDEVTSAVSGALSKCGMSGQKLEWIGYDACLMQVQDIAEKNSQYFNYMVASEESEAGEGWDYDTWIDDLYAKKDSTVIFKAIVDGFIADNGGVNSNDNDQTLSYLNLAYASEYKTAWENMASAISSKVASNASSFNELISENVKHYADTDYDSFCLFDAKDFVNQLAKNSTFKPDASITNAVLTAHSKLVAYSSCGKGAGNSYGLCMVWSSGSSFHNSYYKTSMTNFTTWRNLTINYGDFSASSGGGWWY